MTPNHYEFNVKTPTLNLKIQCGQTFITFTYLQTLISIPLNN